MDALTSPHSPCRSLPTALPITWSSHCPTHVALLERPAELLLLTTCAEELQVHATADYCYSYRYC